MNPPIPSYINNLPLSSSAHEIRVLEIKPGSRYSAIHGSVKVIQLDNEERSRYDALSYTWGDQPKSRHILIEGEQVSVTPNLFNALQHLRSTVTLTIWVDAICINQGNNAERSSQVAMMDHIYSKCGMVHLWLGCPERPMELQHSPFALVEHFRDNKHFFDLPGYWWDKYSSSWKCDTQGPDFRSMMDAFLLVRDSTWWHRAWTAQEAILPASAVFRFGDWTMPLDDFWTCRTNRVHHLGSACCVAAYQATDEASGPRTSIDHVLNVITSVKLVQDANGPYKTLLDIYRRFADCQCKDPRDKIYSLLGFLSPDMPVIVPDYTRPIGEIYVETFCAMIRERKGNPSALMGEGFNSGNMRLPSWVPDFSGTYGPPGYFLRRAQRAYPLFNASGGRSGKLEIFDHKSLRASGFCIGTVKAKSKLINAERPPNSGEILKDWRDTCRQQGVQVNTSARDEAFSALLVGGVTEDLLTNKYRLLRKDDADLPTDSQWKTYMGVEFDAAALPRPYRITMRCMVDRKALFVTSGGHIGLSWPVVEVGDEVWILDGANTPFLLRQCTENNHSNFRLLVGDVYINGLMHGESVSEAQASAPVILV